MGYNRTYVAKNPHDLFAYKPEEFSKKYSDEFCDGWYIDTNINLERMKKILPIAVHAAGLKWGSDVKVYWNRTVVR